MDMPCRQLTPIESLKLCADWLMEQRVEDPWPFLRCLEKGEQKAEWYMIFYPLRALLLASDLLGDPRYREAAFRLVDLYVDEQLPNGAFTSNFRHQPTASLTKDEFHEILRTGKVNLADNGSNVTGLIQAAKAADEPRRLRYLAAARRWLDEWVPLWALPGGGYGNGIWVGHKINAPYTSAMTTTSSALSAFTLATGETEFVANAERAMKFLCEHWLPDGRPMGFDCYPLPRNTALNDYGRGFYFIEGMCWTHRASKSAETRAMIEKRLTEWIFGKEGLLSQWRGSWFNFQVTAHPPEPGELPMSRLGVRPGWEMAKSNGIPHGFLYYLRHINDDATLREKVEAGVRFLSHPLKARMSGVCSDPEESYGSFAVQATGFAGLTLAESLTPGAVFDSMG